MAYLWIKWLHVVSSTILFGTGIGIAFFKWVSDRSGDLRVQAGVLKIVIVADTWFTTPAVVVQLVTGLALSHLAGYSLGSPWLLAALLLYGLAGACWLPVLWLQVKMRNLVVDAIAANQRLPDVYFRCRRIWVALGIPAFIALLIVFYLMIFKPTYQSVHRFRS